jgi:hypothetical protein
LGGNVCAPRIVAGRRRSGPHREQERAVREVDLTARAGGVIVDSKVAHYMERHYFQLLD